MNDSLRMGKRTLSIAVAAATILWSVGFSAFVAPLTARAASPGDLVKGTTLNTVYYYGADGKRYAFPNEKTYLTWYSDFSGVQTLSDSALAAIPLGGNVVYRPGAFWVKIQSDPKVYAVSSNGSLRWIETEAVAQGLAGSDWNKFVNDVADVFFVDYTVGASLTSAANAYDGAVVTSDGSNYLVSGSTKRLVSSAGFSANRYQSRFLLDGTGVNVAGLTAGSDVSAVEAALVNTAQTATSVAPVTGSLTVSLASDSPAGVTIADQATSVKLLKFNLSSGSAATVSQVTVHMGGLGSTSAITSLYLYDGDTRLTVGRSLNSTSRTTAFGGLSVAVPAGGMKTLTLVADMANYSTSGETFYFEVASASAVTSTASVGGNFPVKGATMSTSSTDVGSVTVAKGGTITNPTLGTKQHKVAEFKLTAGSSEDISIQRLKLAVGATATDHKNYTLWQDTTKLSDGVIGSDYVNFVLPTPFALNQGSNRMFQVKADVGGKAGDDIRLAFDENSDVYAVGSKYGFGVTVTKTVYDGVTSSSCNDATDECSWSDIQGGKITFAFNGPSATKISPNTSGVTLMKFTITSQTTADIRDIDFNITATGTGYLGGDGASLQNNYQNFRVVNLATGNTLMGPEEFDNGTLTDDDSSDPVSFSDDFTMSAGQVLDLALLVDVKDTNANNAVYDVADGDKITASIDLTDNSNGLLVTARDVNNNDLTVGTDIIPSADLTGNAMEADTAGLTIALISPPSSKSVVQGSSNVDFLGMSFAAGSASFAKVSAITFAGYGDADASFTANAADMDTSQRISSCSIYDGITGALIDGPESFASGTGLKDVAFSGFDWTIPAGQTYKMLVRCNVANLAPSTTDIYAIELNAAADVTSADSEGNAIAETGATTVNTSQTVAITVTTAGTLAVAIAGDTPNATIILGNSTGVAVSKFKFTSTIEAFKIAKVEIDNTSGQDGGVSAVILEYQNQAGETKTATSFLTSQVATFEGLDFYVPANGSSYLTVKVNTGDVTNDNAVSGDLVNLDFDSTAAGDFDAVGLSSGASLTGSNIGNATANDHKVRKTKPTLSLASGSPSGASIPGKNEVLRFNVSADSRGYVTLQEVTFKMTASDNAASNWNQCDQAADGAGRDQADFTFYNVSDLSDDLVATPNTEWEFVDSSVGATCTEDTDDMMYVILDLATQEEIGAGSTKTYALYLDTSTAAGTGGASASSANDDTIRFEIVAESEVGTWAGGTGTDGAILWADDAMTTESEIDGLNVKNLPIVGGTLIF